ncbi:MAG: hypothetical protein LBO00_02605 [Zoogloeaceae bacterium]|jgi:hypothetical protein|nr:hypothetical protein [Zoogloeaceae bacterium]
MTRTTQKADRQGRGFFLRNKWKLLLALFAVVLLSPMGQEWVIFIANQGEGADFPKGWTAKSKRHDWNQPTNPEELAAYEYTHALKLPDQVPKPVPFYFILHWYQNREDTAESYFRHLCQTEAGEYIFKTVNNVEGIYQMRLFPKYEYRITSPLEKIRGMGIYEIEDYANWSVYESDGNPAIFLGRKKYRYLESRRNPEEMLYRRGWTVAPWNQPDQAPYWRYHNAGPVGDGIHRVFHGEVIPVKQLEARYAYTWRGILREYDREYGIFGGELIVLDVASRTIRFNFHAGRCFLRVRCCGKW